MCGDEVCGDEVCGWVEMRCVWVGEGHEGG